MATWLISLVILLGTGFSEGKRRQNEIKSPNIVLILADDLGWADVSWHNNKIHTPRMEELSSEGVRLSKSYVHPKCSPSRAALMTGVYPHKLGRQRGAIERFQPTGLNISYTLLPQLLKTKGYKTHLVGKWHLGYCHPDFLPNKRGFDSSFGQWNHVTNYYTRRTESSADDPPGKTGYDFHKDGEITHEGEGEFSTDLLTRKAVEVISNHDEDNPLFLYVAYQAPHGPFQRPPKKYTDMYKNTKVYDTWSIDRVATISALDAGVGKIVDSLKKNGLYENTVVVFTTDNGGSVTDVSNFPLRGKKEQVYEGGVRGVGFVHSPLLDKTNMVSERLMYVTDWFSTLLYLGGVPSSSVPHQTDSFNMWDSISRGKKSPRKEIILNVDQDNYKGLWSAAIISEKWKLVWGQDHLLKQDEHEKSCRAQLFNIKSDPIETDDKSIQNGLTRRMKFKVGELKDRLMEEFKLTARADYPREQQIGWPEHTGGNFATGWCEPRV